MEEQNNLNFEGELRALEAEYKDLYGDFQSVVELNKEIANRYAELMDCFPTVIELDLIIGKIEPGEEGDVRLAKLKKFR